ncbi:MAG: C25 family cysteine peptidase [candidate division Zixibacteria bacterium]|nr:C25 family cysteine peptidase [candidate division Zixibacteria bacterium]MDH3936881.1 C25 family cysteine peptidase [candidate division Zixibacteria bacterium]
MPRQRCLTSKGLLWMALSTIIAVAVAAGSGLSAPIERTYTFERPRVETVKIAGELFDQAEIVGCPVTGLVGQPALPTKRARILLPYGQKLSSVEVVAGEKLLVGTGLRLPPIEQPFILSTPPDRIGPLAIDEAAYARSEVLPLSRFQVQSTQSFHGYRIVFINLIPVEYSPADGALYHFPEMKLIVNTEESLPTATVRGLTVDAEAVGRRVDNKAQLGSYPTAGPATRSYDLLVISPTGLATTYQPLKDYHDAHGVPTEIHTLDQVGGADPHTVRDYIRNEYLSNGISMVLIGGDDDIIPALDVFVEVMLSSGSLAAYDMPGDFYYGCLDGTFNYDGDPYWAEPTDGEGGGDIDLLPEVGVGRISAATIEEAANMVTKSIAYLESEAAYLSKVLLTGEQLNFGGMGEYGGYAMEQMEGGSNAHGFTTCGFPADQYDIDKLYDLTFLPYNYWAPAEIISRINAGVHIVDHLGHSFIGYAMRTDTTMVKNQLTNTEFCFLYAEGCTAGKFDHNDCWAEYVTVKLATGGFGCIANSRSGLGSRTTKHPVHVINREFWDAILNADEGYPQLGMAMLDARFDLAARIDDPGMRWTYYETNLFADPAVNIKPVRSLAIMFPDGVPQIVEPMEPTSFEVTVTGIGLGEPLLGSGLIHCCVDGTDSAEVPLVWTKGQQYQAILPAIECDQQIEYYISVEESQSGPRYAPDPTEPLTAMAVTEEITLFEDDFETDAGWTISGGQWSRGIPLGQGGTELQYPAPDPTEGCLGPNVMGYNLAGDYENNLPGQHVTSPAIDCSNMYNTRLRFCRWLAVEQPIYDKATVSISTDGYNWTTLWENPAVIADLQWNDIEFDISQHADDEPEVYLRWTMGPTDGGLVYAGWNLDHVRVVSLFCQGWVCGDVDGSSLGPDIADLVYMVDFMFNGGPEPPVMAASDVDGSGGTIDIADLVYLVDYMFSSGPAPVCP